MGNFKYALWWIYWSNTSRKNWKNEEKRDWSRVESERGMVLTGVCIFQIYVSFWLQSRNLPAVIQSFCFYFISLCLSCKPSRVYTYLLQLGEFSIRLVSIRTFICLSTFCTAGFAAVRLSFLSLKKKANSGKKKRERLHCVQIVLQGRETAEAVLQSALRKHRSHTRCESPVARVTAQKKAKCIWDSLLTQLLFYGIKSQ